MNQLQHTIVAKLPFVSSLTKSPRLQKRSGRWPEIRKEFIKGKSCAVCSSKSKLEVHHIKPFHLFPHLELDLSNLIVLCESSKSLNCHLAIGHLKDYKHWNPFIEEDAKYLNDRLKCPPHTIE